MNTNARTKITILGTSGAHPEAGNDTAGFIINDRYLVDTGFFAISNLQKWDIDPKQIDTIIFTHFHHDHYMALPSLLYWLMDRLDLLKIVGPAEQLSHIVQLSCDFLQKDRYFSTAGSPQLFPLYAGESYECESFRLDTCSSLHPVPGLCYRYTDKPSEQVFSFTGDTAYHPPIIEHVRGSKLLIHEASLGPAAANPDDNDYLHSGALDAARVAAQAGVERLLMMHGPRDRERASEEAARTVFSGKAEWPRPGRTYYLPQ